jgi:hypothetical protein
MTKSSATFLHPLSPTNGAYEHDALDSSLNFRQVADRTSRMNYLVASRPDQVFGYFSGSVVLDDGTRLRLTDFPGFAEDVYNRY